MLKPTVLLVSKGPPLLASLQSALRPLQHLQFDVCRELTSACRRGQRPEVALVLAHLPAVGGARGVAHLLDTLADAHRPCPTLLLVDDYSEPEADALLRAGAAGYLALPDDLDTLVRLTDILTSRDRARPTRPGVGAERAEREDLPELMAQLRRVAPQDVTLLFVGETGTGKTRLARLVHNLSPRRDEPFLVVDCGSLSSTLIESELFGHVKGAFTGADRDRPGKLATAGKGTLLLDEINSLPLPLQGKLLRVVEERVFEPVGSNKAQPVQARLIAASNAPLEREAAEGRFRQDLYYRLNVVGFALPPLRERRSHIAPLVEKFLAELTARDRPDVTGVSDEALQALEAHGWPGNIRELRNAVERAVALCPGEEVGLADLPPAIGAPERPTGLSLPGPVTLQDSLQEVEALRIRQALEKHHNNRLRAAAELGISRMGLYKKLRKYGLRGA